MRPRLSVNNVNSTDFRNHEEKIHNISTPTHRRLHYINCTFIRSNKKSLLGGCLLLSLFTIVCLLFYSGKFISPWSWESTAIGTNYVLPIGDATDKDYYITRPNGRDDGGVVRVMFAIASTRIDWVLCYAVASAYFTNIPIVVSGYKKKKFYPSSKPSMYLSAVKQAGLQDDDVVLVLDSDIMFTGLDYLPFVDKFIKLSPANLYELDAKAIRTGKAMAPSTYGTEVGCYAPQTIGNENNNCYIRYEKTVLLNNWYFQLIRELEYETSFLEDDTPFKFLNSGSSIQRVWSMRKLFAAFHEVMATNKPLDNKEWWCDQSVFAKLYLELRLWEIEQDYFRKHTDELRTMSNEYGLYAGMMGLDYKGELCLLMHPDEWSSFQLFSESDVNNDNNFFTLEPYSENVQTYLKMLYDRTYIGKNYIERNLTRSYSNVHSVTIAPPLLSIVPRHINGKDKPSERVYPPLIHIAGVNKLWRYEPALFYMQWSLPMMFDKEEWKRGKQYTMSMPIELWTGNDEKLRLRYGDVCKKHPFLNYKSLQ